MRGYFFDSPAALLSSLDELPSRYSERAPEPVCKEDEVLVDVKCAGLNIFDILISQGKHQSKPTCPFVLGHEFSGTVAHAPSGSGFEVGQRVFGGAQGAYGERIAVPLHSLYEMPDNMSFEEAAGIFIT
jgi:NADPH2:quinone reductase